MKKPVKPPDVAAGALEELGLWASFGMLMIAAHRFAEFGQPSVEDIQPRKASNAARSPIARGSYARLGSMAGVLTGNAVGDFVGFW